MTAPVAAVPSEYRLRLSRDDERLELTLSLSGAFAGGKLVELAADLSGRVEGLDEVSEEYKLANWLSGVTSGALFAYRRLGVERRRLVLRRLDGALRSSSMPAVAVAATRAVAALLGRDLPLECEGWRIDPEPAS